MAAVGTELLVLTVMFYRLGRVAFDARLAKTLIKTTLACGVVMVIDRFVIHELGAVRLLIDALIYVVLVLSSGAVSVKESLGLIKTMRAQRSSP
jgi:hypothetical protein